MQVSVSLPRKTIDWLDEKGKVRSIIIQEALLAMMKKEALDNPSNIKRELTDLEERLSEIHIRRNVLINKLSYHVKNVEERSLKEKNENLEHLKAERGRQREIIKQVGKVPNINNILKKAMEGKEFDYYKAVDDIRKISEHKRICVVNLKLYVETMIKRGVKL